MIRNIAIINQPTKNRGDEAAHRSLMRAINKEFPDTNVNVIFTQSDDDTIRQFTVENARNKYTLIKLHGKGMNGFIPRCLLLFNICWFAFLFKGYRKIIGLLKESDLVICAPGGICMGGFHNWNHLFFLNLAFLAKKEVMYYSRSIGPFPSNKLSYKIFNWHSKKLLNKMHFVSLRDYKSMQFANDLKINAIQSIDTAFLDCPNANIPCQLLNLIGNDYVVFVPNSLTWHHAYKNVNQNIIDNFYFEVINLLHKKYPESKIVLLPQLFNAGEKSDSTYFKQLTLKTGNEFLIPLDDSYGSDIQQKVISKAKFVIGARYHSIVFAINNQIPFVALSYEHKISGLLNLLSLNNVSINIADIGKGDKTEEYLNKLNNAISETNAVNLKQAYTKANRVAIECFNELTNVLKNDF